jgi:hypothetical protein
MAHASFGGVVRLRGYGTTPAELELHRYPFPAWVVRVLLHVLAWIVATLAILIFTFDPFIASFPFVIGLGAVYRALRGRYRVERFLAPCPSCRGTLTLKAGSKIAIPHDLVCYSCHHEPELLLTG